MKLFVVIIHSEQQYDCIPESSGDMIPRYQLIEIIELADTLLTSEDIEDIDETYEQYRYGLKPGFTLYGISKKCKK